MRRSLIVFVALMLVAGLAVAQHPNASKAAELQAGGYDAWTPGQNRGDGQAFSSLNNAIALPNGTSTEDTATMQYDSGAITALPTVFGQMYGNRFNLGIGGVELDTITLNSFSLYFAEDSTADTGLFFQPASAGATANQLMPRASLNIGPLVNAGSSFSMLTTINVIPQSALGTTGMFDDTFFIGAWCLNANSSVPVDNEAIGLDVGGAQQKGYTASSGASGTITLTPGAFNAVLRANVTSPNAVPVELMAFETED